jgi:hypothetical protein
VGPVSSHVGDIAAANPSLPIARVDHGDVAGLIALIKAALIKAAQIDAVPNEDMRQLAGAFSVHRLLPLYTAVIETIDLPAAKIERSPAEIGHPVAESRTSGGV